MKSKNDKPKRIVFRASSVGRLMTGQQGLTEKQASELDELLKRRELAKTDPKKALTTKMDETVAMLIEKRDAPFELSQGAKTYIIEEWLRIEYGYKQLVVTDEMLKGDLCEQDGFALLDIVFPHPTHFREKNKFSKRDNWVTGHPDSVFPEIIEDVKCSFDIRTFFDVTDYPTIYEAQGQTYMHLFKRPKFRLCYCLVNTPQVLIDNEIRRMFYRYGADEENEHFLEAQSQIIKNHTVDGIPPEKRVKAFDFEFQPEYIKELKFRVDAANEFYHTLKL